MSDKFTFSSAGEIQEVEFALARGGYTHPEVKALTKGDTLGSIRREIILGDAETKELSESHFINLGADPSIPWCDFKVKEHRRGDWLKWDSTKVRFYLSKSQSTSGKSMRGKKLYRELGNKPVLNANVLDYLLAHPYLIPEEWKGSKENRLNIFFWGTIYEDADDLYVRYLYFNGEKWVSHYRGLSGWWGFGYSQLHGGRWGVEDPALLCAA